MNGSLTWLEKVDIKRRQRVIVTLLDDDEAIESVTYLSETSLAKDWCLKEEDEAWEHLK